MPDHSWIKPIGDELGLSFPEGTEKDAIRDLLARRISELAVRDPAALQQALYRLDIEESRLDRLGQANPAGEIAALIIERQIQKAISRATHKAPPAGEDDLKW